MPQHATNYSIDELMIVALAREMKDGETCIQGVITPLGAAAIQLARLTHAKNLVYWCHNGWDPHIYQIDKLVDYVQVGKASSAMCLSALDLWSAMLRGKVDFEIASPAQIDKYGNMNNDVIGEHDKPKVRLPGSVGLADTALFLNRILVYVPRHQTRVFVDRVDFISAVGHLPGGAQARKSLNIRGQGPTKVVTNLAIMAFDDGTGLMKLESLHPGITSKDIRQNTGFDLIIEEPQAQTEPPTMEQVELIRTKIDPNGMRKLIM
jgi:glutaconate CoA-transferase subunit B